MTGRHVRRAALALIVPAGLVALAFAVAPRGSERHEAVAVLLEDGTLLFVDRTGDVVARESLGRVSKQVTGGRLLALARQRELRVVVPEPRHDAVVFATLRGRIFRRVDLPTGFRSRAIEVGRASGRIFLAGEVPTGHSTGFGGFAHRAVMTALSPRGRLLATATLREPTARPGRGWLDWSVYDIAVSPNEGRIFISYHGPNTTGADWVDFYGKTFRRCPPPAAARACIPDVHGAVELDRTVLVAATGTPPFLGLYALDGRRLRLLRSGFVNAHLMEFAVEAQRAVTIESCTKTGGMTVVDLAGSGAQVVHAPVSVAPLRGLPAQAICGERISVGRDGLLTVMKRGTITGIGGVMLLDRGGRVQRWLPLHPPPLDVLALH